MFTGNSLTLTLILMVKKYKFLHLCVLNAFYKGLFVVKKESCVWLIVYVYIKQAIEILWFVF